MFFEVIPTEIFRNGGGVLTYSSEEKLLPGQIVLIPLGRKTVTGIVYKRVAKVNFPTKPITKLLFPIPLPSHLLKSIFWLSQYYLTPIPLCANLMIPAGLTSKNAFKGYLEPLEGTSDKKGRSIPLMSTKAPSMPSKSPKTPPSSTQQPLNSPKIPLNSAQKQALGALKEAPSNTRLLRGITGSGKTNIYLQLAAESIQNNQSVILLVPEIALTSQLVSIFQQTFGNRVRLIHSQQTMTERRQVWLDILTQTALHNPNIPTQTSDFYNTSKNSTGQISSELIREESKAHKRSVLDIQRARTGALNKIEARDSRPLIIIGPRSALLSPVHNLGLIIIDEAHESAYYQENPPRYSALRLASFIAAKQQIPCILGTATPNIVDYHLAKSKNSLIELSQKAKSTPTDTKVTVVDLKNRDQFTKNHYFSTPLLNDIEHNLHTHQQSLIFHNRRGSAPLTLCEKCGWQALCPNCYLPMTLHTDTYTLNCHLCGHEQKVPSSCPSCQHTNIIHKGFGTKLLESELTKLFPDAKIARFDGDNNKHEDLASLYESVKDGDIDILIGTQTLARGLDLPHLATVGIIQADAGLALPDFAAEERAFELLTQVIGRVGRGHLDKAQVFIQSYQPDHPVIQTALKSDFPSFAAYLLKHRREQQMPPFTYLARLSITYKTERTTLTKIQQAYRNLSQNPHLSVSPPTPAFHERVSRGFTWQLVIKSTSREQLRQALAPYIAKYIITLDPPSLL